MKKISRKKRSLNYIRKKNYIRKYGYRHTGKVNASWCNEILTVRSKSIVKLGESHLKNTYNLTGLPSIIGFDYFDDDFINDLMTMYVDFKII